jgi:phage replication initiation protein
MDWAKDDTTGLLDLDLIRRKLRRGEVATRFEKWGSNESGIIGQNEAEGETLYIGNRKSESFVRCYDKAAESAAKDGTEVDGPWIRVELEIKKRKAQELWRQILDTHRAGGYVAALVLGLILGLVDFKEPGPDSNKWRWESCSWWLEFLGVGQKVKITVPKPDITLARAKNWLNLIAPTVAIVNEVDPAFLAEALTGGKSKWRPRHKAKLAQWQHEHKTDKEPFDRINEALKALREAEALKALIVARPPSQAGRHWVCQPPG